MTFSRSRVSLAQRLLRGTGCVVARQSELDTIRTTSTQLYAYVESSGGLQEPRRIRAYRWILRAATSLESAATRLAATA